MEENVRLIERVFDILEQLSAALTTAQATKPEQEDLARQITALELFLPTYDELVT